MCLSFMPAMRPCWCVLSWIMHIICCTQYPCRSPSCLQMAQDPMRTTIKVPCCHLHETLVCLDPMHNPSVADQAEPNLPACQKSRACTEGARWAQNSAHQNAWTTIISATRTRTMPWTTLVTVYGGCDDLMSQGLILRLDLLPVYLWHLSITARGITQAGCRSPLEGCLQHTLLLLQACAMTKLIHCCSCYD